MQGHHLATRSGKGWGLPGSSFIKRRWQSSTNVGLSSCLARCRQSWIQPRRGTLLAALPLLSHDLWGDKDVGWAEAGMGTGPTSLQEHGKGVGAAECGDTWLQCLGISRELRGPSGAPPS